MELAVMSIFSNNLGSELDHVSFLLPALGFASADQANAEALRLQENFPQKALFQPVISGRCAYVPQPSKDEWNVQALLGGATRSANGKAIWTKLAARDDIKPAGAYNVALLVDGPRSVYHWSRKTRKHPSWWYHLSEGRFDCFAVWGRRDVPHLAGGIALNERNKVFAARSGRGVIYTRRASFDNQGQPDGFRTGFLALEFSILDKDPSRDDMLKAQIVASRTAISYGQEKAAEPWVDDLDEGWQTLVARARSGFEEKCRPVPEEVEQWRQFFLDQRGKYQAQQRASIMAATFLDGIKGMPWEQALQLVQEAWQLKAVIETHCDSRFDESQHRFDTHCSRVGRMLRQHQCDDQRRAELNAMVNGFVAPLDELWSYSGD